MKKEIELTQAKLAQFVALDAPNRIAGAELKFQRAKDIAEEAQEELKQLEIMYKDQDLEDMTAEFVLNRGKRNAERRKRALAIEESELKSLRDHSIPQEQTSLELELAKKEKNLKKAELDAQIKLLQKEIAIRKVEAEIADMKEEMAKLKKEERSK